jgi:hypothetical protein
VEANAKAAERSGEGRDMNEKNPPPEKQPSAPTLDPAALRPLCRPGTRFTYAMADFDASDTYLLDITSLTPEGIEYAWRWASDRDVKERPLGAHRAPAKALEKGDHLGFLSQGSLSPFDEKEQARATPPFMVSRAIHAALIAGGTAPLTIYGGEGQMAKRGTNARSITVNGQTYKVEALLAEDEGDDLGLMLAILDDADFPMVIEATFQDDNHVTLEEILAPGWDPGAPG